jgi:predicted RNA-binding Zn-ribbon protein involved in translation (DUF1610 family)
MSVTPPIHHITQCTSCGWWRHDELAFQPPGLCPQCGSATWKRIRVRTNEPRNWQAGEILPELGQLESEPDAAGEDEA